MVHGQGTAGAIQLLVVLLVLNNTESAVGIYSVEVEGEKGTGKKTPTQQPHKAR